ncbi:MAG: DUF4259 domain-containing protein [Candidatus Eremiobacteraeota bacterium]|nr:DUF4259 domain-containing protein [Candidatus Eremiobacteraeota bacterium]
MGAWEAGPFDNDDAADFVADFDDAPSVASIEASLEKIASAPADDYIEAPDCSRAVAAAALITLTTAPATDVVGKTSLAVAAQANSRRNDRRDMNCSRRGYPMRQSPSNSRIGETACVR